MEAGKLNARVQIIYLNTWQLGSYTSAFHIFSKHDNQCEPSLFDRNRNSVS